MKTYANVARMIAAAAKDAFLAHAANCQTCMRSGMFDCSEAHMLLLLAVRGDRLRESIPRCEWDPENNNPAVLEFTGQDQHVVRVGGCANHQCYEVGEKVTFRICEPCSKLPKFFGRPLRDIPVEETCSL